MFKPPPKMPEYDKIAMRLPSVEKPQHFDDISFYSKYYYTYNFETGPEAKKPKMGQITAKECNEFLRSLPPTPLWGEEG